MSPRRLMIEWVCVAVALCALAALISSTGAASRLDATLYDLAVRLAGRKPSDDILIVAIDERSLERIGRWPWPRAVHARLAVRLSELGSAAVAFDVIFSEPDAAHVGADEALAAALRAHGRAVLPVHMDAAGGSVRAVLPTPPLAAVAAAGHVNSELDRDGVVRSVFLREGPGTAAIPHLALALLEVAGRAPAAIPGARAPRAPAADAWARDYRYGIPYAGPPGVFRTLSYVDVLEGAVARDAIAGRLVLVGATAVGAKDMLPTPFAGYSAGMAGVEIVAHVLDGLIQGREVRLGAPGAAITLACGAVMLAMIAFVRLRPRASLFVAASVFVSVLLAAVYAPRFAGVWIEPSAALAVLALAYPLWSWRRLQAIYDGLRTQIDMLARASAAVAIARATAEDRSPGIDPVERRMSALKEAAARMQTLHRFLADALDGMTDAVLVAASDAGVIVANARAGALFGRNAAQDLLGRDLRSLFSGWQAPDGFDPLRTGSGTAVPLHAPDERTLLWRATPCVLDDGVGTIVTLTDVTSFAVADARRREALGFLSHDLRAPLSGILAIVGLERARAPAAGESEVLVRIEAAARNAIAMADNFTAIARAESIRVDELEITDLRAVCEEAVDVVHGTARARRIRIELRSAVEEAAVRADAGLVRRAVVNLLQNAIQYGPAESRVDVSILAESDRWLVCVRDRGRGIPEPELERVFSRFRRGQDAGQGNPAGVGLGLALVRVVARTHGGEARARNVPEGGAELVIELPAAHVPDEPAQRL